MRARAALTIVADVPEPTLPGALYSYGARPARQTAHIGSSVQGMRAAGTFFWGARLTNSTGIDNDGVEPSATSASNGDPAPPRLRRWRFPTGSVAAWCGAIADFTAGGTAVTQPLDIHQPSHRRNGWRARTATSPQSRSRSPDTITGLSLADGTGNPGCGGDPDHGGDRPRPGHRRSFRSPPAARRWGGDVAPTVTSARAGE